MEKPNTIIDHSYKSTSEVDSPSLKERTNHNSTVVTKAHSINISSLTKNTVLESNPEDALHTRRPPCKRAGALLPEHWNSNKYDKRNQDSGKITQKERTAGHKIPVSPPPDPKGP